MVISYGASCSVVAKAQAPRFTDREIFAALLAAAAHDVGGLSGTALYFWVRLELGKLGIFQG